MLHCIFVVFIYVLPMHLNSCFLVGDLSWNVSLQLARGNEPYQDLLVPAAIGGTDPIDVGATDHPAAYKLDPSVRPVATSAVAESAESACGYYVFK